MVSTVEYLKLSFDWQGFRVGTIRKIPGYRSGGVEKPKAVVHSSRESGNKSV